MTDPTTPAPALPAAEGAPAAPPAAAPPAPPSAAAQEPAERPRYVNPWQSRPAPAAKAPAPPAPPVAPPAAKPGATAAPTAPDPVAALRADVDGLRGIIGRTVAQDLASVAPSVADAVREASSDPVEQRRLLDILRAKGIGVVAAPSVAPSPIAPPATTINPPLSAAPPVETQEGTDLALLKQYEEMVARGTTFAASNYLLTHSAAITRARSRAATN